MKPTHCFLVYTFFFGFISAAFCDQQALAQIRFETPESQKNYPLAISIYHDIYEDYQRFVRGRDIASINYYGGSGARRDVVEVVLLQQALLLGGFTDPVVLHDEQSYLRTLRQIADGELISSGALVWYSDILDRPDLFHISQPIVGEGEFIVGIYTTRDNQAALAAQTLAQLQQLRAVTSPQWHEDAATLKELGIKQIYFASDWLHIVRMLTAGRADFTLAPFQPTNGMKVVLDELELVPVEGIKVALSGSRHWPVSRKHPRGEEYYQALQKGITILKQDGRIKRALQESGFYNSHVADWTLLNPQANKTSP